MTYIGYQYIKRHISTKIAHKCLFFRLLICYILSDSSCIGKHTETFLVEKVRQIESFAIKPKFLYLIK